MWAGVMASNPHVPYEEDGILDTVHDFVPIPYLRRRRNLQALGYNPRSLIPTGGHGRPLEPSRESEILPTGTLAAVS